MKRPSQRPPDLSHQVCLDLLRRWQEERDERARETLVIGHERLLHFVLRKYGYRPDGPRGDHDDAKQVAYMGLLRAIDKWDETKAERTRFWTYAARWVSSFVYRLRIHRPLVRKAVVAGESESLAMVKASIALRREHVEPTPHALVERAGVDLMDAWWFVHGDSRRYVDLYFELSRGSAPYGRPLYFIEVFPDETAASPDTEVVNALHLDAVGRIIADATKDWDERDIDILIGRFVNEDTEDAGNPEATSFGGETLMAIGKRHGVTRERIRQLGNRILERLRTHLLSVENEHRERHGRRVVRRPSLPRGPRGANSRYDYPPLEDVLTKRDLAELREAWMPE